jgi:hypothetical protein
MRRAEKAQALAASHDARSAESWGMPRDPYIREKFTRDLSFARKLAREYFERYPKDRYATEVESWRQSVPEHRVHREAAARATGNRCHCRS